MYYNWYGVVGSGVVVEDAFSKPPTYDNSLCTVGDFDDDERKARHRANPMAAYFVFLPECF